MQNQTAAYEDDHHPLVRQRFPLEGKMFISGRKVINKAGHPPNGVKFSERLFEKLVDPLPQPTCFDCLALTELIGWANDSLRSKRFRASSSRKLGRQQKRGMTGEGEGREGNACLLPFPSPSPFHFFFLFAPAPTFAQ